VKTCKEACVDAILWRVLTLKLAFRAALVAITLTIHLLEYSLSHGFILET
jgi:hypothetical protein